MSETRTPLSASDQSSTDQPTIGRWVEGYSVPVINERAVRVSAGILLSLGTFAMFLAWHQGSMRPLQAFGMFFVVDMLLRLTGGESLSPTLLVSQGLVRRWQPNWVGAPQKEFAWWLGLGLATTSCLSMSILRAPLWVTLTLCSTCLLLLFLEAVFGYCVGCQLQARLSETAPQHCANGACPNPAHK